jgi:hypothetical protein
MSGTTWANSRHDTVLMAATLRYDRERAPRGRGRYRHRGQGSAARRADHIDRSRHGHGLEHGDGSPGPLIGPESATSFRHPISFQEGAAIG